MKISEARYRANQKWNSENLERIGIQVRKGRKTVIQTHAAERGESLNGFVNRAIDEAMDRDGAEASCVADRAIDVAPDGETASRLAAIDRFNADIESAGEELPGTFERVNFAREVTL